jgi:hypothetical protein
MPDYRWGIFLNPSEPDRKIGFGDVADDPVWTDVPGEHRAALRRLIVTQADTEPASVEQQRKLGTICPSQYDLRNLFQVNVEEGRHLWAMVYLLHRYFGRDGRDEGDELLARRAGSPDKPRILATFNQPVEDWLDFFMFTMFTDRDGKFQLLSLAESAFEPLARSAQFMLTEEAHHLFVGETGIDRVVQRGGFTRKTQWRGIAPRRDRSAGDPALPELVVLVVPRSVWRRGVVERGDLLRGGAQGPSQRGEVPRSRGARRGARARGRRAGPPRQARGRRATRDQRGRSRQLHPRLPARRSLEPDDRERGASFKLHLPNRRFHRRIGGTRSRIHAAASRSAPSSSPRATINGCRAPPIAWRCAGCRPSR